MKEIKVGDNKKEIIRAVFDEGICNFLEWRIGVEGFEHKGIGNSIIFWQFASRLKNWFEKIEEWLGSGTVRLLVIEAITLMSENEILYFFGGEEAYDEMIDEVTEYFIYERGMDEKEAEDLAVEVVNKALHSSKDVLNVGIVSAFKQVSPSIKVNFASEFAVERNPEIIHEFIHEVVRQIKDELLNEILEEIEDEEVYHD